MSAERSNRSPSGRPPGKGKPGASSGGRSNGRSGGGRSGSGHSGSGHSGSGQRGAGRQSKGDKFTPKWRESLDQPVTAAQKRAAEVDKRRGGPRPPRDPDADRRWAEERVTEEWIDEGPVREDASAAAERASSVERPRREARPLDPDIGAELVDALGNQRGVRLSERLAQASEALDRERFDEARRIASSIAKEAPSVSAVQEVLGLASYRLGRYKPAVAALQQAQELHENPALLPVIADAYRGLRRWSAVERVWDQIKAASPSQEVMSEGRIVMASALADQGDVAGAIAVMQDGRKPPKRVREHHLREWYVLGDLYDRLGETITARRWFGAVADEAPDFFDVHDRLRGLGR
ncbi:MAG: tetratricopeptide repeat protein [Ilumatobacter sp.]|nr:tetratricopeptide repeat protein [Ilumatobacter sp.]